MKLSEYQIQPKRLINIISKVLLAVLVLGAFLMCWPMSMASMDLPDQRISLSSSVILVDSGEATYVQFAAKDLCAYLTEISGKPVTLSSSVSPDALRKARTVIAIGEKMALAMGADLRSAAELGGEGSVIRSFDKAGTKIVVVAGTNPHGTNLGVSTLMGMIRREDNSPYLEGPLDLRNKPSISFAAST